VGGGRVLDAVLGEPVGEAGFVDGAGLEELLDPGALLGGQHRGAGGVGGDQGAARERPVRFCGGVGGALLGVGAAAQRLAQRGGGAGAGAVGAATVGDRAVVPAGGGDLGPVGLQEACGLVDRGALAFDGEGGLLLRGGELLGVLIVRGDLLLERRDLRLGGGCGVDGLLRLRDGGAGGVRGVLAGLLLQLLELLAGEGVGLFGAGLGLLGPLSLRFGGLDLFGADGVLGRIGGVRVLEGGGPGAPPGSGRWPCSAVAASRLFCCGARVSRRAASVGSRSGRPASRSTSSLSAPARPVASAAAAVSASSGASSSSRSTSWGCS